MFDVVFLQIDSFNIDQTVQLYGTNSEFLVAGKARLTGDTKRKADGTEVKEMRSELEQLTKKDWVLLKPYLAENNRLFGISIERLLIVGGEKREPERGYRKIRPRILRALQAELDELK